MRKYLLFVLLLLLSMENYAQQKIDDGPVFADSGNLDNYELYGRKWNKRNLKYYIYNNSKSLTPIEREGAIRNAFNTWQSVSTLTFTQVYIPSDADLVVKWVTKNHGDGFPFEGADDSALAHAFYPETKYKGELHFNDDKKWTVDGGDYDLETVALHEIGHLLGIKHSSEFGAVMNPYYWGIHRTLEFDDIDAVTALYSFKIIGATLVSDVETYTTPKLSKNAVIKWSTSNSNLIISNGQGSYAATFKRVGNGVCDIYAQVKVGSNVVYDTLKTWVGIPEKPDIYNWPKSNSFIAGSSCDFIADNSSLERVVEYEWTIKNRGVVVAVGSSSDMSFVVEQRGTVDVEVRARNACGWSGYTRKKGGIKTNHDMPINSINDINENGDYEIQLWSTNRMIRSIRSSRAFYNFDLENQPSGLYLVKVVKNNKTINVRKILK